MSLFRPAVWAMLGLIALGSLRHAHAWSQEPPGHWPLRLHGSQDGLTSPVAFSLCQEPQGFLWVGTEDGVFRFDGDRFDRFGLAEGLPSDIARWVSCNEFGVAIGTMKGPAIWTGQEMRAPQGSRGTLWALHLSKDTLWVGTTQGAFSGPPDGPLAPVAGWPGGACTALYQAPGGILYAASHTPTGPRLWRGEGDAFTPVKLPPLNPADPLESLVEDPAGNLYARTRTALLKRGAGSIDFKQLELVLPNAEDSAWVRLDQQGRPLLPTSDGLFRLEGDRAVKLGYSERLSAPWVQDAMIDHEGSTWIAGASLARVAGRGLIQGFDIHDGFPGGIGWSILRDSRDRLWVGTNRGLAEVREGRWQSVPGTSDLLIHALVEAPDGRLVLSGFPGDFRYFDPESGELSPIPGVTTRHVFGAVIDKHGRLYAGSKDGLLTIDLTATRPTLERVRLPGSEPDETFYSVSVGPSGRLYAPGLLGLAIREDGTWRRLTERDGLAHRFVSHALETRSGELLIASPEAHGIKRYRWDGTRLVPQPAVPSAADRRRIYSLFQDSRGRVWVGTGQGIVVLSDAGEELFTASDGLPSDDISNQGFFEDRQGVLWIGTSGGLARFDGANYATPLASPTAFILSAEAAGQPIVAKGQVKQGSTVIRLTALTFAASDQVRFKVQLSGEEPFVTNLHEIHYASLDPGAYTLEVAAQIGQGPYGLPARLSFEVQPLWHQTWWTRLGLVAVGLLLIAGLHRLRVRVLAAHNRRLEALIAARTQALEEASVTDPLTGLKNRRYLSLTIREDVARVLRGHRASILDPSRADLVFILVDIDHFKRVNDDHGHPAGDAMLVQISQLLVACVRETDTVVRWGGEEFLVLVRDTNREDAPHLAERIRAQVADHNFVLPSGLTLRKTCSIGFAPFPMDARNRPSDWERVVTLADQCLYLAKRTGRNRWVGLTPPASGGPSETFTVTDLVDQGSACVISSAPLTPAPDDCPF